jgi:hypothetical protein
VNGNEVNGSAISLEQFANYVKSTEKRGVASDEENNSDSEEDVLIKQLKGKDLLLYKLIQTLSANGTGQRSGSGLHTVPFLGKDNYKYFQWKVTMKSHFIDQNLWDVVEYPITSFQSSRSVIHGMEDDDVKRGSWMKSNEVVGVTENSSSKSTKMNESQRKSNRAFTMLLQAISKCQEAQYLMVDVPHGNAHEVWKRLEVYFQAETLLKKNNLITEIENVKMQKGETITQYVSRVKKIMMELQECNLGSLTEPSVIVLRLVRGLESPKYDHARMYLQSSDAMGQMTLQSAINYLLTQEAYYEQENRGKKKPPVTDANGSTTPQHGGQGNYKKKFNKQHHKGEIVCWKCSKPGHTKSECKSTDTISKPGPKCDNCGLTNHATSACFRGKKNGSNNSKAPPAVALGAQLAKSGGVQDAKGVELIAAGSVQCEAPHSKKHTWHLDSGAARHNAPKQTTPLIQGEVNNDVRIRVASGQILDSPHEGSVMLHTPNAKAPLLLHNVLTHEQMKSRLMSVSQICDGPNISGVWFDKNEATVYMQPKDESGRLMKREVLMKAPRVNGVYVLHDCEYVAASSQAAANGSEEIIVLENNNNILNQHCDEALTLKDNTVSLWHSRLGHIGLSCMARLISIDAVAGLDDMKAMKAIRASNPNESAAVQMMNGVCGSCALGKSHRAALGRGEVPEWVKATQPMDRWSVDTYGPYPPSLSGKKYLLLIVDEGSDKTFGSTIVHKSDQIEEIKKHYLQAKVFQGRALKEYHSDGAGEFVGGEMEEFWSKEGTKLTPTLPHTSVHNAKVERKGRTIVEEMRTLLHHAKAPVELWAESAFTAIYLHNMVNVQASSKQTPNQRWTMKDMKEKVKHLRTWGCDAWVHIPKQDRTKLEAKAVLCIFIGYQEQSLGYRFYSVDRGTIIKSKDARFVEDAFTQCELLRRYMLSDDDRPTGAATKISEEDYNKYLDDQLFEGSMRLGKLLSRMEQEEIQGASDPLHDINVGAAPDHDDMQERKEVVPKKKSVTYADAPMFIDDIEEELHQFDGDDSSTYVPPHSDMNKNDEPLRRSTRVSRPVMQYGRVDLRDVAAEVAEVLDDAMNGNLQELSANASEIKFDTNIKIHLLPNPSSMKEMYAQPDAAKFQEAIEKEHASLDKKEVLQEVDSVPPGKGIIKTRYVFARKLNADGELEKHKARLVVLGNFQVAGRDYDETDLYAPTVQGVTTRIVFVIAAHLDYEILQFDVTTAYLNAVLKEEVYVTLPKGSKGALRANGQERLFRLLKALYGLKQAGKEWNKDYNETITTDCGFTRCAHESCLYFRVSATNHAIYVPVHVDDFIVAFHPADKDEVMTIVVILERKYELTMKECTFMLGVRVQRDRLSMTITLDQQAYLERLLLKAKMSNCVAVSTPEQPGMKLVPEGCYVAKSYSMPKSSSKLLSASVEEEEEESEESNHALNGRDRGVVLTESPLLDETHTALYASLVGGLMYAAVWTRPDIAHATGELTRFISKPRLVHLLACYRVLRYLKGCTHLGLTYGPGASVDVVNTDTSKKSTKGVPREDNIQESTNGKKALSNTIVAKHLYGTKQGVHKSTFKQEETQIILGPVYADANWAGDLETRRSTSGILIKLNGDLIMWQSKRQKSVAVSSTEAEFMSLGQTAREVKWLRMLLDEIGCKQQEATMIYGDNQASIIIAKSDIQHKSVKHIDIQDKYIREQIIEKNVQLNWIPTLQQQADILTKGLGRNLFNGLRNAILGQKRL